MSQAGDKYDYEPGTLIPGSVYLVIEPLGQGGMGTVYRVEDTTIGKHYALKTINREFADRMDLAARMRKEARALVAMRHPNIVDVITLGQTADLKLLFIVMEYLEGSTLKAILRSGDRRGRLDLLHVLDIAIDVADALEKAHAEGFVHRDIKPENIFVVVALEGTRAKAVVLDFGIIGQRDKEAAEDRGQFMGTPRYGAPEQVVGGRCVAPSDLYSLAVVMYEAIAGHGPFPRAIGATNLASAHLHEPAPRLSTFVPDVNPDLDELLHAALQKAPSARAIVDKATGRRVPLTATSMGSELRRIRREEDGRRSQHGDENKTQETLLGVLHARGASESTIDDPNVADWIAAGGPGRATTLVGLAPVDEHRRDREPSGPASSTPARTPLVSGSRNAFAARPEVLSKFGGGWGKAEPAPGVAPAARSTLMSATPGSLVGVPAATEPIPPPVAGRAAQAPPGPPTATDASPAPGAPDSWRRVRAAMALAERAPAPDAQQTDVDEMEAAKTRVPLMGPAAGRLQVPARGSDPSKQRAREITDASASSTIAPQARAVARPRFRRPIVVTAVILAACVIVLGYAAIVAASRSWQASPAAAPGASATTVSVASVPVEPVSAAPSATTAPTPSAPAPGFAAGGAEASSVAPSELPRRAAPQPARLPPAARSPLINRQPLGSSPGEGDPFPAKR